MIDTNLSNLIINGIYSANRIHSTEKIITERTNRTLWAIAIKHIGKTEYYANGKTIISDKNHIAILPKGCSYKWQSCEKGECLLIDFDADLTSDSIYSFEISDLTDIINTFYKMEHERALNNTLSSLKCIEYCYHLFVKLLETKNKNYSLSSKENIVKSVIDYITSNYNNTDLSNDMLGKIAGVSTVYFRKVFTEVYNMSPMNYVHNLRMKKAAEILKTDHGSISDIAFSVGYSSIYNFSKMFKKYFGVAPSKFV